MKKVKKKSKAKKSKSRPREFGAKQFVDRLWKTMKGQEKKHPEIALLHERLEGTIKLVGLTGGIASGKSTVAQFFKEAKVPLIDADEIAREVVRPGKKAYRQIVASFGEGILREDRTIDRENLGRIVFNDESKRTLLESITHPEIFTEIKKKVAQLKKKKVRTVIVDAALLFESGLFRQMHKNILVRIDPEIQLRRLMKRDNLSEIQAWQRVLAQMPTPEKEKLADFVIDNSGSVEETRRQVLGIILKLI